MIHSESIKDLAAALAKAQGQMEAASKDRKNQFGGVYADLGSVIEAAKTPLAANGLSVSQHPEISDGRVSVTTLLMHASGEWLESSISSTVRDNNALSAAQQAGIVITYLRRYALSAIVGIYADEDTDGNEKVEKKPATQPSAKPAQPAATVTPPTGPGPATPQEKKLIADLTSETVVVPVMSYEEASKYKNREDVLYIALDTPKLNLMRKELNGKLFKREYQGDSIAIAESKLAAINAILEARAKAPK